MEDGKQLCSSCAQEMQQGASFCSFCGVAVGAHPTRSRSASDPYLLLMTANVLRLRRQWSLAEAKCSELLKLDPENAAAHSLMGDILRDQERVQDAIEWYKLAVDRDPANETDRRKLEALIERRFTERRESCVVRHAKSFLGWLRKSSREDARVSRPACPWAMGTAGVFAAVLLTVFGAMLMERRASPPPPPGSADMARYARPEPLVSSGTTDPEKAGMSDDVCALEQTVLQSVQEKALQFDVRVSRAAGGD